MGTKTYYLMPFSFVNVYFYLYLCIRFATMMASI